MPPQDQTETPSGQVNGAVDTFPAPMFSPAALGLLAAGLCAAAWFGQVLVVLLIGTMLALAGLARGWSALSLRRLAYSRRLHPRRAFAGETVTLTLGLENRKPLPLTFVEVSDEIPLKVAPDKAKAALAGPTVGRLSKRLSLLWYERAVWREELSCRRRGYYSLGPARLVSGDLFGLLPRSAILTRQDHLVVYPAIHPVHDPDLPCRHPLGEVRVANSFFADPIRPYGLRPAGAETPFRHIHWKASAKTGSLQAKVFEASACLAAAVCLGGDGFSGDAAGEERFELAVSAAASLADHLLAARNPVGLFANLDLADGPGPVRINPASNPDHLTSILEALAKVENRSRLPFPVFLDQIRAGLPWGASLILVLGQVSDDLGRQIKDLSLSGFRVKVYLVGPGPLPEAARPGKLISSPADLGRVGG